LALVRASSS